MKRALCFALLVGCGPDLDALRGQDIEVRLDDAGPVPMGSPVVPDAPDAGPPAQQVDPVAPEPTCGLPGLECCDAGLACEVGACLRGRCAASSGAVAEGAGCSDPCAARNPFTAGCGCAIGFARSDVGSLLGECSDGSPTVLTLGFCDGGYGSAFVELDDACGGCASPHPITGACMCPAGQLALRFRAGRRTASCGDAFATLGVCVDPAGRGAYQRDPLAGCVTPNRATGGCACPDGSVEQRLPLVRPEGAARVPAPVTLCLDP